MPTHARWTRDWWYEDFLPWLEPVATVCAFVAAVVAVIYTVRVYRKEVARELEFRKGQRKSQASLVSGWFEWKMVQSDNVSPDQARIDRWGGKRRRQILILRNASEVPVFDLVVFVIQQTPSVGKDDRPLQTTYQPVRLGVLPPSDKPMEIVLEAGNCPDDMDNESVAQMRVHVRFIDAAGQEWARTIHGELVEPGDPDFLLPGQRKFNAERVGNSNRFALTQETENY